jgi:hypothetical protein
LRRVRQIEDHDDRSLSVLADGVEGFGLQALYQLIDPLCCAAAP